MKIKPCCFCSSHNVSVSKKLKNKFVECHNPDCLAYGPVADSESGAVRKWNAVYESRFQEYEEPPALFLQVGNA